MTDCIFCRIVQGSVPAKILAQSDTAIAFADVRPQAPFHVLVIPRTHYKDVAEMTLRDPEALVAVFKLAGNVVDQADLAHTGYRMVFNTGFHGGQTVFHAHLHILGQRKLAWPPG